MGWETALVLLAMGAIWFFLGPFEDIMEKRGDNRVKIAEANARAEEAKLEQKRLYREHEAS